MNNKKRYKILLLFKKNNPNPKMELIFSSTFELLISVILSARTKDSQVNEATRKLYSVANTPKKIINLGIKKIKYYIKNIGLFNVKSNYLIQSSILIENKYNGLVPRTRKKLMTLPGVGRKTANIILNVAFKKNTIAVDTHVFRVVNRINFVSGKNVSTIEKKLIRLIPLEFKYYAHSWFVLHGRYICLNRKPKCDICIIFKFCEFFKKNDYLSFKN
ncbi:endonuclease III [Buchnera aphidicola (Mindarus keteleerifoliae)]|uniref:endonuclease III n=1 Tax=Buchnera aphidicola TaxID=9 RepID=UPI0031B68630